MDQPLSDVKTRTTPLAVAVLAGLVIAFFAATWFSAQTQNATELTPKHPDTVQICIYLSLLVALGCAALVFLQTRGAVALRIMLVAMALVLGFAAPLKVSIAMTNVAQMRADFPAGKTETYAAQWPVVTAYRLPRHRQVTSYSIRTAMLSGPIDIHYQDFNFMHDNTAPEDISSDGDVILGHGRFCANVILQRSGDAIRLMVGPEQPLPIGSIGRCSPSLE